MEIPDNLRMHPQDRAMLDALEEQKNDFMELADNAQFKIDLGYLYKPDIKNYQPWLEKNLNRANYLQARLEHLEQHPVNSNMRRALLVDIHHEQFPHDPMHDGKKSKNPDTDYDTQILDVYSRLMELDRYRAQLVVQAKAGDEVATTKATALQGLLNDVTNTIDTHFQDPQNRENPLDKLSELQTTIKNTNASAFENSPALALHRSWASEIIAKLLKSLAKVPLIGLLIKVGMSNKPESSETETEKQVYRMEAAIAGPS